MITIVGYQEATNENGEPFNMLKLQGEVEMVQSEETGRHYATARKTMIASTFDDAMCEKLIGKEMPGAIEKVPCDPYEYEIPETGEKIILEHSWQYNPEPVSVSTEEHVFEGDRQQKVAF
ncbi:hypothetical protein SAMN05443144_1298 [Fodinibius roseus]|uniref:Uncharacterized protein n=1 Tax=Fodinibius roseus TaxID=1194090 RepID=A0A1M5K0E3_9BACT|nr:hypothetical protein [Fodinibius roseus]SHG46145.1 hypothetical protein SAMN05443144_1298 [Fodinibius roseus]